MSAAELPVGWIVLGAAALALALVAVTAVSAWRAWRRVRVTADVAVRLSDAHVDALAASSAVASERTGRIADGGERLAAEVGDLRREVGVLRWMVGRIPAERARLRSELLDLVLPTRRRSRDDD